MKQNQNFEIMFNLKEQEHTFCFVYEDEQKGVKITHSKRDGVFECSIFRNGGWKEIRERVAIKRFSSLEEAKNALEKEWLASYPTTEWGEWLTQTTVVVANNSKKVYRNYFDEDRGRSFDEVIKTIERWDINVFESEVRYRYLDGIQVKEKRNERAFVIGPFNTKKEAEIEASLQKSKL
jgi:hypothetical protein